MSNIIRDLRKALKPRGKKIKRVPRQFINQDDLKADGERQETFLVMSGHARTIREARRLLDEHGVSTAKELRELLPAPRRRRPRWISLLMHMQGATDRNLLKPRNKDRRLRQEYKFRR